MLACFVVVMGTATGVGLAALHGGWGLASETPPPIKVRTGCADVRRVAGETTTITGTAQKESICGTAGKDRITAVGGNDSVWGKDGDDAIDSRNLRPDLISGGGGYDTAKVDSCDTVTGVEKPLKSTKKCRGVTGKAGNALLRTAVDYYDLSYLAIVECHSRQYEKYGFSMRIAEEPTIFAVDTTKKPDWQFVTFIPLLYEWDGPTSTWKQVTVRDAFWLWDWTTDAQDEELLVIRNFWRRDQGRRSRTGFSYLKPNTTYQMRLKVRWYPTNKTKAGSIEFEAGDHFGDYESDKSHAMCTFPAAPPPEGARGLELSQIRAS